jgi:aspartyl-tRNA(Asn)/glutamyl-tRNA(Gln) amidotransferase subunit A
MEIREWEKLGIETAIEKSRALISEHRELNAVLAVDQDTKADEKSYNEALLRVPYLAKDNMATLELPTTAASKILEGFVSPYEATVIRKLREAGAVLMGKTNMDEFAMGSSTENSAFGTTLNPWDKSLVPGGSSGGSAAAVAAGLVPFALGSDTGGSIRQPAAFCGVVGLMPTYGRVSRYGLLAMASSLDRIGPFTNTVEDAARVLQVIAGRDDKDSTTLDAPVPDYLAALTGDIKGIKIGIAKEFFGEGLDPEVEARVKEAIEVLKSLNAEIIEEGGIALPHAKYGLSTYYIIQPAEVSANLSRYDGMRYGFSAALDADAQTLGDVYSKTRAKGFGAEVKRRIMLGAYTLSAGFRDAYYDKAQKVRQLIKQDFESAFNNVDVLVSPTTPTVAFKVGEKTADPLSMYKADLLTTPASMAGIPAISLPCGLAHGLPVGLQIMAPQLGEEVLLKVADAYEKATQDSEWVAEYRNKMTAIRGEAK